MLGTRIIPRLDIKGANLVKGVRLEGLRVVGDPAEYAQRYYEEGADEIFFQDIVASLYGRNSLADIVSRTAERLFIPLTVGGGIRSCDDIRSVLHAGADKVAINTAAIRRPEFITDAARAFGSQAIVVAIEAIKQKDGTYEAFTDNGREHTGREAVAWAKEVVDRGAGEILLTSVDREGTRKGFDLPFLTLFASLSVPIVVHGGIGSTDDIVDCAIAGASGIAIAHALHYGLTTIRKAKAALVEHGIEARV